MAMAATPGKVSECGPAALPDFLLLQVNDALFPLGAFAHSFGLETYVQKGLVHDGISAQRWLVSYLQSSVRFGSLLSAALAYEHAVAQDLNALAELEERCRASSTAREAREANGRLGSRFVKTALPLLPQPGIFAQYARQQQQRHQQQRQRQQQKLRHQQHQQVSYTSHAVAYAVFCCAAGIPKAEALAHFLYAQTSALVTTCVKSIPLSQTEGQALLVACHPVFEELLETVGGLGEEWLFCSCPGLELRSMQHERLYSRLYIS
jgi:urease accessory protein